MQDKRDECISASKESEMPEHRPAPDAPGRAVDATIDRILDELTTKCDPETLNEIRATFRRRIPFRLRSYAAALLLLEASESGRGRRNDGRRGEPRPAQASSKHDGAQRERKAEAVRQGGNKDGEAKRGGQRAERPVQEAAPRIEEPRPRYDGEATTVFFGMGKRQRLYPRVLLRILTEDGGLALEDIGDIRSFDNYSFADVDPSKAEAIIAELDGFAFRGRGIPVSKARKRGEAAEEPQSPVPSGEREAFPSDSADFDGGDEEGESELEDDASGLSDEASAVEDDFDGDDGLSDDFTDEDEGHLDEDDEEGRGPDEEGQRP